VIVATVTAVLIINRYNHDSMQQTLSINAQQHKAAARTISAKAVNMAVTIAAGIAGAVGFIIDNGTLVAAAAIIATAAIFFGSTLAQEKPQDKKGGEL